VWRHFLAGLPDLDIITELPSSQQPNMGPELGQWTINALLPGISMSARNRF